VTPFIILVVTIHSHTPAIDIRFFLGAVQDFFEILEKPIEH
jgi:hypothetical protein